MKFKSSYMYIYMILCVCLYVSHAQEGTACESESVFFHNYQDCSTYFWCVDGILLKMHCPDGLEFNLALERCKWPDRSDCEEEPMTIEERCEQDPTAIIPHPTECQLFYDCSIVYGPGPRVFDHEWTNATYRTILVWRP